MPHAALTSMDITLQPSGFLFVIRIPYLIAAKQISNKFWFGNLKSPKI